MSIDASIDDAGAGQFMPIDQLNFSDLYVRIDAKAPSRYRIGPNAEGVSGNLVVPGEFDSSIDYIRNQIEKAEADEGTIQHDTMRLRFSRANIADNQVWASIRRIPLKVPTLRELSVARPAIEVMRTWARHRGIVLICGATGAGKTTTGAAYLQDSMERNGGTAVALEDPPEYLLQGEMGEKGVCFQMRVEDDNWRDAVKTALRWRPRLIFVGEIRTPESAKQALRASTSGHLVVATIHGGSVEEAIGAMISLSTDQGTDNNNLLADNLVGVVHQRLARKGPDVRLLNMLRRENDPVVGLIRTGKLARISEYTEAYDASGL